MSNEAKTGRRRRNNRKPDTVGRDASGEIAAASLTVSTREDTQKGRAARVQNE